MPIPIGPVLFLQSPFYLATQTCLVSSSNPTVYVTINDLEIGALLMQILIFAPRMSPLAHIHMYVNNTATQVWSNRGSVSTASSVGKILWDLSLEDRQKYIHASIVRVPVEYNKMADAASRLTHLPYRQLISHFRTHFPQSKPWRMLPLPSTCRWKLINILNNKPSQRFSLQTSSRKILPPGANGVTSAAGCKFSQPR